MKKFILIALTAILASCASTPEPSPEPVDPGIQAQINEIKTELRLAKDRSDQLEANNERQTELIGQIDQANTEMQNLMRNEVVNTIADMRKLSQEFAAYTQRLENLIDEYKKAGGVLK
jgi:septal ring factor EnvC (AmiA/AmiB activator)